MKRKRYTEEQVISILNQHESGRTIVGLARQYGIADKYPRYDCPTFHGIPRT